MYLLLLTVITEVTTGKEKKVEKTKNPIAIRENQISLNIMKKLFRVNLREYFPV